jgi:GNAT superfamily N-acetyltransferase
MQIVRLDTGDEALTLACCEVTRAVRAADDPADSPEPVRVLRVELTHPGEPGQTWFVPGPAAGSVAGLYHLRLPDLENRDRAALYLEVHPDHRRRGIGAALLRHAAERAADDGRSVLSGEAFEGSAGDFFARRAQATPGLLDARRMLVLAELPAGTLAALRTSAASAADGYSLVSWAGRTPDEHLDGIAAVFSAMNDGPRDPGREDRIWDARRVRERVDGRTELYGSRAYAIAARHDASGEMAALTRVSVYPERPEMGNQQITAVTRAHRGHRLGLLVKTAMLQWLAEAEPQLQRLVTWNAAANEHMIAINEALGYQLLSPLVRSFEIKVADILGRA